MSNYQRLIPATLFFLITILSSAQNINIYGLWWDSPQGNEHLVQLNPLTGQFTSIGIIPNVNAVNLGSSTFDQRNSRYIFRGREAGSNSSKLFSINVVDASLANNPTLTESVIEWEYDLRNSKLYGLKFIETGQLYDTTFVDYYGYLDTVLSPIGLPEGNEYLVSLDLDTGENTNIGFIDGVTLVSVNSSTFNSNDGTYIFIGKDSNNVKKLYNIDVVTGNVISSPAFTDYNYFELEYSNVDDKIYAIQNNNGSLKYGELDLNTANFTLLNDFNFLSGGGVAIGNTILDQQAGYYVLTGVVSGNKSIYIIDALTGNLINTAPLNENINEWEIDNYTNFARTFYQLEDDIEFCNTNLILDTATIYSGNYQAGETLKSQSKIKSNANITFTAKDTISLQSNFSIEEGATFSIKTDDCIEDAGCCPEDPLTAPFLQNYVSGEVGYMVFQAKDVNRNCLFRIESDYGTGCEVAIADLPVSIIDCVGASVCYYGGFTPYPINTCIDDFGTSFNNLDWQMIFSCGM